MFATMLISDIWVPWYSIRCFPTPLLSSLWSAFHMSPVGINSTRFPLLPLVISHSLTPLPSLILPINPDYLAVLREPILSGASTLWWTPYLLNKCRNQLCLISVSCPSVQSSPCYIWKALNEEQNLFLSPLKFFSEFRITIKLTLDANIAQNSICKITLGRSLNLLPNFWVIER